MNKELAAKYKELQAAIGIDFPNLATLDQAFVHKSYMNESSDKENGHNERLEFLGDAVLELAATRHLYDRYQDQDEGVLTALRSALVKGNTLAEVASELQLGEFLYLSKGEEKSGGRQKNYILANLLEALIGAIYLECGFDTAHKFIEKFILSRLDVILEEGLHIDSKSKFQEKSQELLGVTPNYELLSEDGPDHLKKFTMGAYISGKLIATGSATSKQKAEQVAAQNALNLKKWN